MTVVCGDVKCVAPHNHQCTYCENQGAHTLVLTMINVRMHTRGRILEVGRGRESESERESANEREKEGEGQAYTCSSFWLA